MISALLLTLLFSLPAHAEEETFHVETNRDAYDPAAFATPGVQTHALPAAKIRPDAIPDRDAREKIFANVPGLAGQIAKMDEVDRDLLFTRAKTLPEKELKKLYPKITAKSLAGLRKAVNKK